MAAMEAMRAMDAKTKTMGNFTIPGPCRMTTGVRIVFGQEIKVEVKSARTAVKIFQSQL